MLFDQISGNASPALKRLTVEGARSALAQEAGDRIWAALFDRKRLTEEDLEFLVETLYWFRDNPVRTSPHERMELIWKLEAIGY